MKELNFWHTRARFDLYILIKFTVNRSYFACFTLDQIGIFYIFGDKSLKSLPCFGDTVRNCAAKDMLPIVVWWSKFKKKKQIEAEIANK